MCTSSSCLSRRSIRHTRKTARTIKIRRSCPLPFGFLFYASCRISDQRIAFRAICSVDRIEPYPAIPNMDLEPVAIMLHFVRSARPLRRLLGDDRLTRTDESMTPTATIGTVSREFGGPYVEQP